MKPLRVALLAVSAVVWPLALGYALVRWALDPWVDNATATAIRSIGGNQKGRTA